MLLGDQDQGQKTEYAGFIKGKCGGEEGRGEEREKRRKKRRERKLPLKKEGVIGNGRACLLKGRATAWINPARWQGRPT